MKHYVTLKVVVRVEGEMSERQAANLALTSMRDPTKAVKGVDYYIELVGVSTSSWTKWAEGCEHEVLPRGRGHRP